MIGFPRILKTKTDYLNCHKMAMQGKLSKSKMVEYWKLLLIDADKSYAKIKKIGLTVEEVKQKIAEVE
jgi:hypothetical protein